MKRWFDHSWRLVRSVKGRTFWIASALVLSALPAQALAKGPIISGTSGDVIAAAILSLSFWF